MPTEAGTTGLVTYIVTALVDEPDKVVIDVKESEGAVVFELTLAPDDVGKVIGRQGRIIKAIRTLARAAGAGSGTHIDVEVLG